MVTLLYYLIQFCCILFFVTFTVISLFFTYCFLYLLSSVKHFGTPKWIVVKGCINKLHLHLPEPGFVSPPRYDWCAVGERLE